jgi:predicted TIM-barrel fold metal-dependent hydrolase
VLEVMLHDGQEYVSRSRERELEEYLYDSPEHGVFWGAMQELAVPVYLHPKEPLPQDFKRLYKTRPWLVGPDWTFARDAWFQVMVLATSGLFDRFPGVKLMVGHVGEMIIEFTGQL